ncbi:hypothetical protein [Candidatus Cyanaurora vandensis]|uniref:hypothetical protein n=1 Tax=Candidatus Cyanaurora vandensis TaxID=2714958 RepID=UPI00257D501C|nr:hypothetical protein [Candidatus Cyanaurora vandensis]
MKKFLALVCLLGGPVLGQAAPPVPPAATSISGLVPQGWQVLGQATGDLNRDQIPDVALVLKSPQERDDVPESWDSPRFLVLALGTGRAFTLAVMTSEPLLRRSEGGIFGAPFEEVAIVRGALILKHYGGSRNRWSYTDRYRYQAGGWFQIGRTESEMDTFDLDFAHERDLNLNTGLVIETQTKGKAPDRSTAEQQTYRHIYYELRAGQVAQIPALGAPWPGTVIQLNRNQVVSGQRNWQGTTDLATQLVALVSGDDLYLRATVQDERVLPGDGPQLINAQGRPVPPTSTTTETRPGGYICVTRYPLKALGVRREDDTTNRLRVSVEIRDRDTPKETPTTLSTSRGGRKYPARLQLVAKPGLPRLDEVSFPGR